MSNLGSITLNEIQIFEIDSDPTINGLTASTGSLAILTDGSKMFLKNGEGDTAWIAVSPNSKYVYSTNSNTTITSTSYSSIANLTSDILPIGLYRFALNGQITSTQGVENIRIKLTPGNAEMSAKYANGSILDDGLISSYGIFRITKAGTVAVQLKSAISGNTIILNSDCTLIIEPIFN